MTEINLNEEQHAAVTTDAAKIKGPLRCGDLLEDSGGNIWSVSEVKPGGHIELFDKARSRSFGTYQRMVRVQMRRVSSTAAVEVWKAVAGYEGLYEVSSYGAVRSVPRVVPHGLFDTMRPLKGRTIKGWFAKGRKGEPTYRIVALSKNGIVRKLSVSNLVCDTFHPNPSNLPCVNHKDGNKQNNHESNLEHCTWSHNNQHAFAMGLKAPTVWHGEEVGTHKLTNADVLEIRRLSAVGLAKLGRRFGVSPGQIWRIINRKAWRHI